MNRAELAELIRNGENSGVEFKRDDVQPERLAAEIAALLNLEGGHILLGVEDDGAVTGLVRESVEAWVMEVVRIHVRPAMIPYWEMIEWEEGTVIGIITLPADGPDKPYKAKRGTAWMTKVRVGSTTRDATDEEEARLYQQSGRLSYDRRPVSGSTLVNLDRRRLTDYFRNVRRQECPDETDEEGWQRLLINTDLMTEHNDLTIPTVAGILFFGQRPNRYLPQVGITAVAYQGTEKDYDAQERSVLQGPVVSLLDSNENVVEAGVIDQAIDFLERNTRREAHIEGARRVERTVYPPDAVREAVVNAVAHRDYSIAVRDIELSIYTDRLEVVSPGRLPNTVTIDRMRAGYRASRNELLKEVLRDYRYIEATGLGIPRKIIEGMRVHNGTEPDLIAENDSLTVRLWKNPTPDEK